VAFGAPPPSGHHHHQHHQSSPAYVRLRLDKLSYVGGDVVQGTVEMQALGSFVAQGVFVKIEGYETAKFQEVHQHPPDQEGHRKRDVHLREDRHEFFCQTLNVFPHAGPVSPGLLSFPFQYKLPENLPGTYFEEGGDWSHHVASGYLGEIIYYIQARVEVQGMPDALDEQRFIVNEKSVRDLQPSYAENSKTFMFTKGKLAIKVWLDSHTYFPGNTVLAKMEANNTSTKHTRKLWVKVYRHLNLKAHSHHKSVTQLVYSEAYDGFEPSWYGVRFLPFQIPLDMPPSSKASNRVKARYDFTIECEIGGAINLVTHLDCSILAPQFMFAATPPELPPLAQIPDEASFRPPWQPDEDCNQCNKCGTSFGFFTRRHHCRHDGKIYCGSCASKECLIPNLGYVEEPVRVCDECFDIAKNGGQHYEQAPDWNSNVVHSEPEWERPPPSNPGANVSNAYESDLPPPTAPTLYPSLNK